MAHGMIPKCSAYVAFGYFKLLQSLIKDWQDRRMTVRPSMRHDTITKCNACVAVGDFKLLQAVIKDWPDCPRAVKRALLPELSVEHAEQVLEPDNRLRSWKGHPTDDCCLFYCCSQAQLDFDNPAGKTHLY